MQIAVGIYDYCAKILTIFLHYDTVLGRFYISENVFFSIEIYAEKNTKLTEEKKWTRSGLLLVSL